MFKKRDKHYLVTLITKTKKESMQVRARSSKEAISMVRDVVSNCSLFGYQNKDFDITCKRIKGENR